MYIQIKQAGVWYSWVLTKSEDFEDGSITVCQKFTNQAEIKYAKTSAAQEVKFTGSDKTINKYIVRMIADSNFRQRALSQYTSKPCTPAKKQSGNNYQAYVSE